VDKLLLLTDVDGVRSASGAILEKLSAAECRELIRNGVATGGMRAKLESAIAGLESGIGEVVIAPGARPGIVGELVLGGNAMGTRIT
jgi:acetylglutamate kinase